MKKIIIALGLFSSLGAYAQNNVGIGTLTPNSQAILEIKSSDKGVLISRLTTVARNTLGTALTVTEDGMLVYDKDVTAFYYWDGPNLQWVQVGSGNGDNWGTDVVQTSGANISGDGTTANPLTVTDGDSDPTNEIELPTGGTSGQVLSADGSGTYTWVSDNAGTDNQNIANLAFDNTTNILTVGIQNGTSQTIDLSALINDADSNPTNEIQDLAINTTTNILEITNNGSATNIDLTPYLDNTDNQDLSLTGNTLSLTNDGTTVDLSGYLDNTDNQNINGSGLSGTALTIGIQNGTNETINLSSLVDHDWHKVGTTSPPTTINDNIFTQGNVGIGTVVPDLSSKLDIVSTSQGLLLPRMTTAQRDLITSPANSLIIFNNTTQCLQINLSSQWQNIYCDMNCTGVPSLPQSIIGQNNICQNSIGNNYSIPQVSGATSYTWSVPSGATITSGQGTTGVIVDFGTSNGNVSVNANNNCGSGPIISLPITLIPSTGTQVFSFTGNDQTYTIPSTCASFIKIQCWGAASGNWATNSSGAGGYTEGVFNLSTSLITAGQVLRVMVGQGGVNIGPGLTTTNTYGFGGGAKSLSSTGSGSGGGLSGVFIGNTPILFSDAARALVVAGGGGGTGEDDCFSTNFRLHGGSGNDNVNSGGMVNFQGVDGNSGSGCGSGGYGGGGGGYLGGSSQNRNGGTGNVFAGNGGSSYVEVSATSSSVLFTPEFSGVAPNNTDVNYISGVAVGSGFGSGGNGLVVITYY